ncbi:hypothetical protein Hanom_Chr16g01440241 [Helianthus anomalus]
MMVQICYRHDYDFGWLLLWLFGLLVEGLKALPLVACSSFTFFLSLEFLRRFFDHCRGKTSAVCGPHLQTSAAEEVDQTSARIRLFVFLTSARYNTEIIFVKRQKLITTVFVFFFVVKHKCTQYGA